MKVEMELSHLITLLLAFFSCIGAFGKLLLGEFEKRQQERFEAQEKSRKEAQQHWVDRFASLEASGKEWSRLERDMLELKSNLAMQFVLRDDYIRSQYVIHAKLDAVSEKILRGAAAAGPAVRGSGTAQRQGLGLGRRGVEDVVQNLIREFGVAEAVDSLLLRPLAIYLGLSLLTLPWGVLAGKVIADFIFYGPVLGRLHWRLGSRGAPLREVASLRSTQAVPITTLGDLRLLDDPREARPLPSGTESGGTCRTSVSDG